MASRGKFKRLERLKYTKLDDLKKAGRDEVVKAGDNNVTLGLRRNSSNAGYKQSIKRAQKQVDDAKASVRRITRENNRKFAKRGASDTMARIRMNALNILANNIAGRQARIDGMKDGIDAVNKSYAEDRKARGFLGRLYDDVLNAAEAAGSLYSRRGAMMRDINNTFTAIGKRFEAGAQGMKNVGSSAG